jgi:hypothetical protein
LEATIATRKIHRSRYNWGKDPLMSKTPAEPTNLVLEQLRLMRAETNARFDQMDVAA